MDNVGPVVQSIQKRFEPLTKAIADNKDEFAALWDFIKTYLVPLMSGALKLAFNGIVSSLTTVINVIGKAVDLFQSLYEKYKQLIDFLKNNPISKFLGSINPFSNTSFDSFSRNENFAYSKAADYPTSQAANFTNPFAPSLPFSPTQAFLDAIARRDELKAKTDEIRARIEARKNGIDTNGNIVINVNAPSVIDEEGFTRSVIDALNSSQARLGSLGTLNI
jgi:hypothetical protein